MKITKSQLKQIIKEEYRSVVEQDDDIFESDEIEDAIYDAQEIFGSNLDWWQDDKGQLHLIFDDIQKEEHRSEYEARWPNSKWDDQNDDLATGVYGEPGTLSSSYDTKARSKRNKVRY
jgi:hypothetical protein